MRKFFKITAYVFLSILVLIVGLLLYLQSSLGQKLVTKKVTSYLQNNIHPDIKLGAVRYQLISNIEIENLYVPDQDNGTLADLGKLEVAFSIWGLINNKLTVKSLNLEDATVIISRTKEDTVFSFNYIIEQFSSEQDKDKIKIENKDKSKKAFELLVQKVALSNIHFSFLDEAGGSFFSLDLDSLRTNPKIVDFANGKYEVDALSIKGLRSHFESDISVLPESPIDTSATSPLLLWSSTLAFEDVQFSMLSRVDSMFMDYTLEEGLITDAHFDLVKEYIEANELAMNDGRGEFVFANKKVEKPIQLEELSTLVEKGSMDWEINIASIRLNKIDFKMDDPLSPRLSEGMDYSHMYFQDAYVHMDNVYYRLDSISGKINHTALKEQSGLELIELRSYFVYTPQGAALTEMFVQTPQSILRDKLIVSYKSLDDLLKNLGAMEMDINLDKSKVAMSDALLFIPESIRDDYKSYAKESFSIEARLKGKLNDLNMGLFKFDGLAGTNVDLSGKIKGLPDPEKLAYNFNIRNLNSNLTDIDPFLPEQIKQSFDLPNSFAVNGELSGGLYEYYPDLILKSTDGDAYIKGHINIEHKDKENFDLFVKTDDLDIGKILKMSDDLVAKVTIEALAKGQSFDPAKMNANIQAKIFAAQAMGYNYHDIVLNAMLEEGAGTFDLFGNDPNLHLNMLGEISLREKYPMVNAQMDVENLDLYALKFMSDTFKFKGRLSTDFISLDPDYPDGVLSISNGQIVLPSSNTTFDSLYLVSRPKDGVQDLYLNASNLIFARLTGRVPITKIGTGIMSHIDRHYHLGDTTITAQDYDYDMSLNGYAVYHPILKTFLPNLYPFDSIQFNAQMDAVSLKLDMDIPQISYGGNILDSGYVRVNENKDTFNYSVGFKEFNNGPVRLRAPSLRGIIRNDSIYAVVNVKDSAMENQFAMGGSIHQDLSADSSLTFIKLFRGINFDYQRWAVNPNNQIVISPQGLLFRNFQISKDDQSIAVQSQENRYGAPFDIDIKNLTLSNFTKMLSGDTLIADGVLNVDGNIDLSQEFMKVNADLAIQDLMIYNYPFGNLSLDVTNPTANEYATNMNLRGAGNDLRLNGSYYLKAVNGNHLDFDLKFNPFSLKSIEGLTFGTLKNSSGGLLGEVKIKGKPDAPVLDGFLEFFTMQTTIAMLGSPFKIDDQKVYFDKDRLRFSRLKIYDSQNHEATVDGTVQFKTLSEFIANLNFRANKWYAIQSKKSDNPEFYGDLVLSSNLNIRGDVFAPRLDGNITIHDETDFTYAMLDHGPGLVDHEGIVDFYDGTDSLYLIEEQIRERRVARSSDVNVNVDIAKNAKISLMVDPVTGEGLQAQGQASLNAFMAPDGTIGLTGIYELEDGFYELKFNVIKRKFKIQKGSTITLSGDPLDADADIVAVYKTNVAPYDLVVKQVAPEELNYYKQRIPLEIHLKIDGKALSPNLDFDIVMPEGASGVSSNVESLVSAKLTELRGNASEMNKQVFGILLLNKFIAENPFSTVGSGMETAVKQTVGRFLSDQLNQIAGDLIDGFELNVDLDASDDYSTGSKMNRTDLNISASKRLFNDRVKVTIGNNFGLEGAGQVENKSVVPGNLAIDYNLTEDGRYQLRAYRTNEMRNILDGYTSEAGLNFRMAVEYNRFKYLFINRRKQLERLRQRRQKEEENRAPTGEEQNEDKEADKSAFINLRPYYFNVF